MHADILLEEKKLLKAHNDRLLDRVEQLNEQITEFESTLHVKNKEFQALLQLINSNFLVQRVQFKSEADSPYVEEGILCLRSDVLAILDDYLSDTKLTIPYTAFQDLAYDSDYTFVLQHLGGELTLRVQSEAEFAKLDLGLWAVLRRSVALD